MQIADNGELIKMMHCFVEARCSIVKGGRGLFLLHKPIRFNFPEQESYLAIPPSCQYGHFSLNPSTPKSDPYQSDKTKCTYA